MSAISVSALRDLLVRMREAAPKALGVRVSVGLVPDTNGLLLLTWEVPCPCDRSELLHLRLHLDVTALASGDASLLLEALVKQARHELAREWTHHRERRAVAAGSGGG